MVSLPLPDGDLREGTEVACGCGEIAVCLIQDSLYGGDVCARAADCERRAGGLGGGWKREYQKGNANNQNTSNRNHVSIVYRVYLREIAFRTAATMATSSMP